MSSNNPLTVQQIRHMSSDLKEMKLRAEEMSALTRAGLGEADQRTIRAEELVASIQRMQWAIEREGRTWAAAAGV